MPLFRFLRRQHREKALIAEVAVHLPQRQPTLSFRDHSSCLIERASTRRISDSWTLFARVFHITYEITAMREDKNGKAGQ